MVYRPESKEIHDCLCEVDTALDYYGIDPTAEELRVFIKGFDAASNCMKAAFVHHYPDEEENKTSEGAVLLLSELYKRLRKAEKNN